ncbi:unnamed protein product [Caenorhabditis brenneri]
MEKGQKLVEKSNSNASAAKRPTPSVQGFPEVQIVEVPKPEPPQNVISSKYFVMKHTFPNYSSMKEGETRFGPIEDHFGLTLSIKMGRRKGFLQLHLFEMYAPRGWHVDLEARLTIFGKPERELVGNREIDDKPIFSLGWTQLNKWDSRPDQVVDDSLTIQFEIRINEMAKVGKKVLRNFDATMEGLSDVVLVVRNQKFYVSKYTLASHSEYFNALLLGPYKEANMPEITLHGVDPFDIQNYLEFLYLQPSIDEETVEGLRLLADQYDTAVLKKSCEGFLIKKSKKSLKKKFEMFLKYNCTMEKIINEMRTPKDVEEVIDGKAVSEIDRELSVQLLVKMANLSPL